MIKNEEHDEIKETFGMNAVTFASDETSKSEQREKETLTLKKLLSKLSEKEMRFVEGYIKTLNATEAFKMTGTVVKNPAIAGYSMMQKEHVQTAIAIALKRRIEAIGLDETGIIQDIKRVYDQAMEIDKLDVALKAAELLGVHIGMFTKGNKKNQNNEVANKEIKNQIISTSEEISEEREEQKAKLNNVLSIINKARDNAG